MRHRDVAQHTSGDRRIEEANGRGGLARGFEWRGACGARTCAWWTAQGAQQNLQKQPGSSYVGIDELGLLYYLARIGQREGGRG